MGIQDDAVVTCAAYRVTENGQTWCFTTSPGEELLDAAQTLRRYCTDTEYSTGNPCGIHSRFHAVVFFCAEELRYYDGTADVAAEGKGYEYKCYFIGIAYGGKGFFAYEFTCYE